MSIKIHAPLRVAILTNIVPRYRTPVFSKIVKDKRFQLRFFVSISPEVSDPLARDTLDLRQTKTFNFFRGTQTQSAGVTQKERMPIPVGLFFDLLKFRPDVIISGDMGVRSLMALFLARWLKTPLIIWTEETIEHDANVGGLQKRLRRFLLPRVDGFLAWGKSASNYLLKNGVTKSRITYCAQAVDNDEWISRAKAGDPLALKISLGLMGKFCLAVGRLLPRKGFKEMIFAYAALPEQVKDANSLVLVGDGEEMDSLRELAKKLNIGNFFMVGSKTPDELAVYYRAANFMILSSLTDVWGLVVNEAIACDTPVISSIHAGVTKELIVDTGIGEAFDPNNQVEFTAVLLRWIESPPVIDMGVAEQAVGRLNFDVSVKAITGVLQNYVDEPPVP